MTLDEIISNAEFCANEYKKFSEIAPERSLTFKKYEEDHRQLAEWLRELKQYREGTLPTNDWIPVSERLPELNQKVLCSCRANILMVLSLTHEGWYEDSNHCYMTGFVLAWMPLPEPYEPQERR